MSTHVLVVDDAEEVVTVLRQHLTTRGFDVEAATSGTDALAAFAARPPDVVVLDITMPGRDGLSVLREIRTSSQVPVILLTGLGGEVDRVVGLELGADDYVVKPFGIRELEARIGAVLRRASRPREAAEDELQFGALAIDPRARSVCVADQPVDLTVKEFDLLLHLARAPRTVFSREDLLRAVWDSSGAWQTPATVNEHVRRLRVKLGDDPNEPRWIATSRGVGYMFLG